MTFLKQKNRKFIYLARNMDADNARDIRELLDTMKVDAVGLINESKRCYPKGKTAAHILGATNIDNEGIGGLELKYNEYLKGEFRNVSVGMDARGTSLSSDIMDAVPGNNLLLTIDEGIQYIVERELSTAMEQWNARAAVAIMMDPRTGEILAMSNRPTYDPNVRGRAPSPKYRKKYEQYWGKRRNRSITDLFEPGSTLKSVLASAAVEEGVVDFNEKFDVSKGYIVVGGKRIRDAHKHEILTFKEIIQKSSNVGAVRVGQRLGEQRYYRYLRAFGFGEKSGIDYPGERSGLLREPDAWSGTSLAALSIGQEIGVTPLQVLRAYAAIANGGLLMKPYIVSDIISPTGEVVKKNAPVVERRVISRESARAVTNILKTVVEEGGTAPRADIEGNLVAGKTGTAQIFDHEAGRYSREKYVSSFVGFAPADNPKLALIVVIFEPEGSTYGGVVAAPVFKNIIEHTFAYLDVPMERNENQIYLVNRSR